MNNMNPLVPQANKAEITTPQPGVLQNPNTANPSVANNSLNTFQDIKTSSEIKETGSEDKLGKAIAEATAEVTKSDDSSQDSNKDDKNSDTTASDERLKRFTELYGDTGSDLIDCISKLNAYVFRYTPEAQEAFDGEHGVDDDTHVGVMAQELETNPATPNVVEELPNGVKTVNTQELTLDNTALISALAKRVLILEEKLDSILSK